MPRLSHSSLLVDKSSDIVFFTALCIIRGKVCTQTVRNVQLAEMGLGQLHCIRRVFAQPPWGKP